MSKTFFELHDLSVQYGDTTVLWSVDLALKGQQIVGIIGPNGAGKSTLIKASLGLIPVASGWSEFFGQPINNQRQKVAYVPQRASVDWDFPVSAFDVVLMGRYGSLKWYQRPTNQDYELAYDALKTVDMIDFAQRQISQLSGGQQQRVFLARALAQQAKIYFLDEPFAGVDVTSEETMMNTLKKLCDQGCLIIVVHHDLQTALDYFDQVILLNRRIIAKGQPEDVLVSSVLSTAYNGHLNLLDKLSQRAKSYE